MNKAALKEYLIELEQVIINEAELDLESFSLDNDLDQDGVLDIDDFAQADSNVELEMDYKKRINNHKMNLQIISDLPINECKTVKPGAVVKVNGEFFIVAIAHQPFEFEGKEIEGISVNAPIYKLMQGKKAGDSYQFNNKTYTINEVY